VGETAGGPREEKSRALVEAAQSGPVAVVFGPEPHGLSNAEVTRCHGLVHIPVDPAFPALNLAQSVAICCYELYRLSSANPGRQSGGESWTPGLASGLRQQPAASFAHHERP